MHPAFGRTFKTEQIDTFYNSRMTRTMLLSVACLAADALEDEMPMEHVAIFYIQQISYPQAKQIYNMLVSKDVDIEHVKSIVSLIILERR